MNRVNQAISGYVAAFSDAAFNLLPTLLYLILSWRRCSHGMAARWWWSSSLRRFRR